jgi:hypothetical protein
MLVIGSTTPAIGFVLVAPRTTGVRRGLLLGWAVAVAAYGYVDLGNLVGRRYEIPEYAPASQAMMERVRRYWRGDAGARLRDTRLVMMVPGPFPLGFAYGEAAVAHAIEFHAVDSLPFCRSPVATIRALLDEQCGAVGVILAAGVCGRRWPVELGWQPARAANATTIYLFRRACDGAPPRDPSAPEVVEVS